MTLRRKDLTANVVGKEVALRSRLSYWAFYTYSYMFSPLQLAFICSQISAVRDVPGGIVEIGCAYGNTTVYLNRHLDDEGIEKPYTCIDTFQGFTPGDVEHERRHRGKSDQPYADFASNDVRWFRKTLEINGIERVSIIEGDAAGVDYRSIGPIAFVLLDVDLYRPVQRCLEELWDHVSPGGIVVIDDCSASAMGQRFDGALQAYLEFCSNENRAPDIAHGKLGVLRK